MNANPDRSAVLSRWATRRLRFGLITLAIIGLTVSLIPAAPAPAEAVLTPEGTPPSANASFEESELCNAPWGKRIPVLNDNEVVFETNKSMDVYPGTLVDSAFADLNGDAKAAPVRVMRQSRLTGTGGVHVVAFEDQKLAGTFIDEQSTKGAPDDLAIAEGDVITPDDENYPRGEVVYASLYGPSRDEPAAFADVHLLGEELDADGYIRIQLDREISDNFYNVRIYLETGDFDGDGDEDIVVAVHHPEYGITLHVLEFESGYTRGAGQSSLREVDAQKILPDEYTSVSFGVGDIDRDYRDELVVSTVQESYSDGPYQGYVGIHSYALSSQGSFFEHARAEHRGLRKVGPVRVAVGDVNGDTFADVVTVSDDANASGSGTDREVVAWSFGEDPNLIAGRFPSLAKYQQAEKSFPLDMRPMVDQVWSHAEDNIFDLQVGDVDRNGLDDVLIGTENGSSAGYWKLQSRSESARSAATFFESVEMPDRSEAGSEPLMSVADVDGDSVSATLGAGTFDLPTCNDTVNPDFTMEANLPPQWTGITKEGLEEGSRFMQLGTQETNGVSETGGITTISGESIDWATRLTVEVEAGAAYFSAWAEYRGSRTETNEDEDTEDHEGTVTENYGVYAESNEVVRVDVPMRCYNYSVYQSLAPVFEPAKVGEISTEEQVIPRAGVSSFGSVEGLMRRCKIDTSTSTSAAADTPEGTEEANSLYGSNPVNLDSQYTVIRPDWSSIAMFMGDRTSQSSGGETAGFAVDGLLSRGEDPAPVARTDREDQPWWQIDLGEPRRISSVRVLAGDDLRNVGVMLSNKDFSQMPESSDPAALSRRSDVKAFVWNRAVPGDFSVATADGNVPMSARYIRVQRAEDDVALALTEVQVFGESQIDPSAYPEDLIAPPEPELGPEESKTPPDPNAIYQVRMWDRYENTFKWVDQRGDMFANFRDKSKYKWNDPEVSRGSAGISFDWVKEFTTAFGHTEKHETVTSHGMGAGVAGGVILKDFAFDSSQAIAYLEVSGGKDWFSGDADATGTGTTIGKGTTYFEAMSGWDPHPDGTLLSDGTEKFAQYPNVCKFTFTPNISTRFQTANSGYRHSYLSVDYVVNEKSTLGFKRSDPKSRVCSLGTYRVDARNAAPTAPDFIVHTQPGVPVDMDVLSEAMDEFSVAGTGVQADDANCSKGHEPETKHAADCNEYQKLAIYGIAQKSGSGDFELINTGRLNIASHRSESLIRYTPTEQDESAALEYTVTDGESQATGHITVQVETEPPTAKSFTISPVVGEPRVVDVLTHVTDPAGLDLTVIGVEDGDHTKVELVDGVVTATSSKLGADTFTYTVSNGRKTATAEVEVEPMLGQSTSGTVGVEQTLEIPAEQLGIADGDFTISKVEPGDHTFVTHHDGAIQLRPLTAEEDTFTYTVDVDGVEKEILVRVSATHRKGWSAFEDIEAELGEVSFIKSSAAAALPTIVENPGAGNGAVMKWPKTVVGPDGTVVSQILFRNVDFGKGDGQLRLVGKAAPGSGRGAITVGVIGIDGEPNHSLETWWVDDGDEYSVDLPVNITGVYHVALRATGSSDGAGLLLDSFSFERDGAGNPGEPDDVLPPTANDVEIEDAVVGQTSTVDLKQYFSDPAGLPVSVVDVGPANKSLVVLGDDGVLTVTPWQAGSESFTYTVSNGTKTATGTVTVRASAMPETLQQSVTGTVGVEQALDVPVGELGIAGKEYTITGVTPAEHTHVVNENGALRIRPLASGEDSFTYTVVAGEQETTVTVTVSAEPKTPWNPFERMEVESAGIDCPMTNLVCPYVAVDGEFSNGAILRGLARGGRVEFKNVDFGSDAGSLKLTGKFASVMRGDPILTVVGVGEAGWNYDDEAAEFSLPLKSRFSHLPENLTGVHDLIVEFRGVDVGKSVSLDFIQFERTAPEPEPEAVKQTVTGTVGMEQTVNVPVADLGFTGQDVTITEVSTAGHTTVVNDGDSLTVRPLGPDVDSFTYTVSAGGVEKTVNVTVTATHRTGWSAFEDIEAELGTVACIEMYNPSVCPVVASHPDSSNGAHLTWPSGSQLPWIQFGDVDFGEGEGKLRFRGTAAPGSGNGEMGIEVDFDGIVRYATAWQMSGDGEYVVDLDEHAIANITGIHNVNVRLRASSSAEPMLLDSFKFERLPVVPEVEAPMAPDIEIDDAVVGQVSTVDLTEYISDPADLPLTVVEIGNAQHSLVTRDGTVLTVTPLQAGNDTFTYTVSNGSKTATGTVTVRASTPMPETLQQSVTGTVGMEQTLEVPLDDLGIAGREYTITGTTPAEHTHVVNENGAITIRPLAPGEDSFTYTVAVGEQETTITVMVSAEYRIGWSAFEQIEVETGRVECPPINSGCPTVKMDDNSSNGAYVGWGFGQALLPLPSLKMQEVDFGSDEGRLRLRVASSTESGTGPVQIRIDGRPIGQWDPQEEPEFWFDLEENIVGVHDVTLVPQRSNAPRLSLDYIQFERLPVVPEVEAPNAPSIEIDDAVVGQVSTLDLTEYISDPADLPLTVVEIGNAQHSLVTRDGDVLTVTPLQAGSDTFTYTVSNGSRTATGTVTVHATAPEPEPEPEPEAPEAGRVVIDDAIVGEESTVDLNTHVSDPAGLSLTIAEVQSTDDLDIVFDAGVVTVTPLHEGEFTFTYTVSNGSKTTTGTVTVHATAPEREPEPEPEPEVVEQLVNGTVGMEQTISVPVDDLGIAGQEYVITEVTPAAHSDVVNTGDALKVRPGGPHTDAFSYTVLAGGVERTVEVTVTAQHRTGWSAFETIEAELGEVSCRKYYDSAECPVIASDASSSNGAHTIWSNETNQSSIIFKDVDFGDGEGRLRFLGKAAPGSAGGEVYVAVDYNGVSHGVVATWEAGDGSEFSVDLGANIPNITGVHSVRLSTMGSTDTRKRILDSFSFERERTDEETPILPPNAVDDNMGDIVMGEATAWDVLGNDWDPAGLPLTITEVTDGEHTTVVLEDNKIVATASEAGRDSFTYTVTNGTTSATATVTLTAVKPAPVIEAPIATTFGIDTTVDVPQVVDIFTHVKDPADLPLTLTGVTDGENTTVMLEDGVVTATSSKKGTDNFTYTVTNGVKSTTGTVIVHATAKPTVPQAPIALDDRVEDAVVGEITTVDVLRNDSDPADLPLTVTDVDQGRHSLVVLKDGVVTVTPLQAGGDTFTYTVSNGVRSATATVWVTASAAPEVEPGVDGCVGAVHEWPESAPLQLDEHGTYTVGKSALRLTNSCVEVLIWPGTTITGPAGATISAAPRRMTLTPEQMGKIDLDATAIAAVTVGAANGEITLDPFGAWIVIAGAGNKDVVGFFREGEDMPFERITTECSQRSTSEAGPRVDCYTSRGNDLIVWTHHFTTFVAYDLAKAGQVGSVAPGQAGDGQALQARLSTTGSAGGDVMIAAGALTLLFGGAVLLLAVRNQRPVRRGRHGS